MSHEEEAIVEWQSFADSCDATCGIEETAIPGRHVSFVASFYIASVTLLQLSLVSAAFTNVVVDAS